MRLQMVILVGKIAPLYLHLLIQPLLNYLAEILLFELFVQYQNQLKKLQLL